MMMMVGLILIFYIRIILKLELGINPLSSVAESQVNVFIVHILKQQMLTQVLHHTG